jgi:hypothetical protein
VSDEHVIAHGLGGRLILPMASCWRCAKITSQHELHNLRRIFMPARAHLSLPSRKGLPKKLPVEVELAGQSTRHELPMMESVKKPIPRAIRRLAARCVARNTDSCRGLENIRP